MNEETRNKIRIVIKENVNPILDRRVDMVTMQNKVIARRKELADAQQKLKAAEDLLEDTRKKDIVEFESLIDLISISGWKFSANDSHGAVLDMLGVRRTAENKDLLAAFVIDIRDRFLAVDDR